MKVALVYDRVNKWGGAERVLLALHKIWPEAPLYTSVYDPKSAPWAKVFDIRTSFLQKVPFVRTHHEWFAWLMPLAFESFNFDGYDLVISVTSAEAKGIISKPNTLHISYILTPTHYLWGIEKGEEYHRFGRLAPLVKVFALPFLSYLRAWDKIASQRPDILLAISKNVQKRIVKYYGRSSEVIYPPVDVRKFQISNIKCQINPKFQISNTKYFLVVSRLVPYKRVDIVVQAFNKLGWNLKIIGIGSEMEKLKRMAKDNIEFLGQLTDNELVSYYQNCQAVIFPQEEDFGLVPLEAQACGKPVIAYRGGGATETVIDGKTGLFFYPPATPKQAYACDGGRGPQTALLIKVLESFNPKKFRPVDCREQAEKFSEERFLTEFKKKVEEVFFNKF